MLSHVLVILIACILYYSVSSYLSLRQNIKVARRSGIPFIVVPVHYLARWWLITQTFWIGLLATLPDSWIDWVDFIVPEFTYDYRHQIFARVGHDTFLTVSPCAISLFTCDPSVIWQITSRRNDFPKPIYLYRAIDLFGKNVVTTEGQHWRHHRKAIVPLFAEKNNRLVWTESIKYGQAMLKSWLGSNGNVGSVVDRIMDDSMRLSLYVISGAGFGRSLDWPSKVMHNCSPETQSKIQNLDNDKDPGHTMSWIFALHTLLDTILLQLLFSSRVLAKIPFQAARKAAAAHREWRGYMKEAVDKARAEQREFDNGRTDILNQLVKAQLDGAGDTPLTESEILGNMFVLILAGHETAANSVHFCILYLALYPESQRRLQKDLDQIFRGAPPSQWDYDRDLPSLFGGMAGAILAEELRLVPPVVNIPKSTSNVKEQPLRIDGKECFVPLNTHIALATAAAARNPKHWPFHEPTLPGGHTVHPLSNLDNDLEEFHPERWLTRASETNHVINAEAIEQKHFGINGSADMSERLYQPVKGSYVPFSDGHRACLGRRFAQVEILAVLAVLYQNHSIELAVDKYATDAEVRQMNINDRVEIWQKTAEDARELMLTGMGVTITLQMRKGSVPVRIVPRGKERFPANVDRIWQENHPDKISNRGIPGWRSWKSKLSSTHQKLA